MYKAFKVIYQCIDLMQCLCISLAGWLILILFIHSVFFLKNGTLTGFLTLNNKGLQEILTQESHDTSNTLGCETDFQPPENSNYC